MTKLRYYLQGADFFWLTDCSGIVNFMDIDLMPKHQAQRWKLDMLQFDFVVVHRPDKMMVECDLLLRYNWKADELRLTDQEKDRVRLENERREAGLTTGEVSPIKEGILRGPSIPTANQDNDPKRKVTFLEDDTTKRTRKKKRGSTTLCVSPQANRKWKESLKKGEPTPTPTINPKESPQQGKPKPTSTTVNLAAVTVSKMTGLPSLMQKELCVMPTMTRVTTPQQL
jgi:hypothetical protein